ncbi:molybdopterin converting factor [Tenacibaculum holothuriorum]|uniref:Molybdopterin synthase sulfur carrier subunit n=1 Tax=Tenacibaculum holothuriorum TaxID=1635173 RepID=A0A1Y2PBG5_9FLAO|nr:MoaD/ThiS family protein [Tenacibaculum holothuriorum]OSY87137.1 molybdopterin converting factor [Tenacibaculum holothuriorum]
MRIQILLFGIASDLVGESSITVEFPENISVLEFKTFFSEKFPKLKTVSSYAIAVNESYAQDDYIIKSNDVIAIIPPVSGG